MKLMAVIYQGAQADLTLPTRILAEQGIRWELVEDMMQMMRLARGRVNPVKGWYVYFPLLDDGACNGFGIYKTLDKRGLLYC